MSYVYISYSPIDAAYAGKLAQQLIEADFKIWFDRRKDVSPERGDLLAKKVEECGAYILIMTPHGTDFPMMIREMSVAVKQQKPLFPLLLEGHVWAMMRITPAIDVKGEQLLPDPLLDRLSQHAPRDGGEDLTEPKENDPNTKSDDPEAHMTALNRPQSLRDLTNVLRSSMSDKRNKS